MALFGSKNKQETAKKVRPTVVRTQNVAKEIFNLAKSYDMKPEQFDFNLLNIDTYVRIAEEGKEGEWEEVAEDDMYAIMDETSLLNPNFQIKQTYEIEIFKKTASDEDVFKDFKSSVGANATKCKIYLSITGGSELQYVQSMDHYFKLLIDKKKIRAGILVGIFDGMVDEFVSKIVAKVRINEKWSFSKNETHLIAEGIEPTATRDDALVLHYETKNKELDEKERIDYAQRGFIQSVKQDELLIEYIKAKPGKPGRNCKGEYIKPTEPVVANEPKFSVDEETIKVVETQEAIQYIAKTNGYISFENNTYTIKKEADIDEISFKKTGNIISGVDSDVNLSVKEADAIKDAVGTGMIVEVAEIDIDGNVGSNAKVIAKKAKIGGQTHQSSFVQADEVDINVHKGHTEGKKVHITRLEHGYVKGDEVDIAQALGGKIFGQSIDIGICTSHVKATATRKIEIQKLQGSENIFTIDPLLSDDVQENLMENEKKIKELEEEIRELKKEIEQCTKLVKEGMPAFLDIKKRLAHYKKNGVKMPEAFVKKYKEFQAIQERYKFRKEEYQKKQDQLNLLTTRTASFQDNIFDARIINRGEWLGYNEIHFKLVDPPMDLVYKPAEGSQDKIFGIKELEEGEYVIHPMSE